MTLAIDCYYFYCLLVPVCANKRNASYKCFHVAQHGQSIYALVSFIVIILSISSLVGPLRLSVTEQIRLTTEYVPWALACHRHISNTYTTTNYGKHSQGNALITCYYEKYWEKDIDEVRHMLGVIPFERFRSKLKYNPITSSPFSPFFTRSK